MKIYAANKYEELTWIQKPFNTRQFHQELARLERCELARLHANSGSIADSLLTTVSWMLVCGNRGKNLVGSVFHNGDFYLRMASRKGTVIGSKSVYRQFGIDCTFLTTAEVINLALRRNEARRITRKSDNREFDVAMLHDWPKERDILCSCCIYIDGSQIQVLNPEPTGKNLPEARFDPGVALHDGQLFAKLTAIRKALVPT